MDFLTEQMYLIEVKSDDPKFKKHFVYKSGRSFQEAIGFMILTKWPHRHNPVLKVTMINQNGENQVMYEAESAL